MTSFCRNRPQFYEDDTTWRKSPWAELIFPHEEEDEEEIKNAPFLQQNKKFIKENNLDFKTFKVIDFGTKDWSFHGIKGFLIENELIPSDVSPDIIIPRVAEKYNKRYGGRIEHLRREASLDLKSRPSTSSGSP